MSFQTARLPLVIALCSDRKAALAQVRAGDIRRGSQSSVTAAWLARLAQTAPTTRGRDLYRGRAFRKSVDAADRLKADIAIISAGLGFVAGESSVPAYDLTLNRTGIASRIDGKFDILTWWKSVLGGPYSTTPTSEIVNRPLVLVCVSRAYAPLIEQLLTLTPLGDTRLFGQSLERSLPKKLHDCIMPYDERLDATVLSGTRSDFAARALLHFAMNIYAAGSNSLERDRQLVRAALSDIEPPPRLPRRRSLADSDIAVHIRELLPSFNGSRTAMLRHLRAVDGVACEQSRFARLHASVSSEKRS